MRLTTSPPLCAEYHEIWEPKSPGTLWVTPGLLRDSFTFTSFTSQRTQSVSIRETYLSVLYREIMGKRINGKFVSVHAVKAGRRRSLIARSFFILALNVSGYRYNG